MAIRMPLASPPASPIVAILHESKYQNTVSAKYLETERLKDLEFQSRPSPDGEVRSRDLAQYYYAHSRHLSFVRDWRWESCVKDIPLSLHAKGICMFVRAMKP